MGWKLLANLTTSANHIILWTSARRRPLDLLPVMNGASSIVRRSRTMQFARHTSYICRQCRAVQISAAPTSHSPRIASDAFGTTLDASKDVADARFEVLGTPYSLLSVSLSASQRLYTRRGTLVAVSGKPENAQSILSVLSPFTRGPLGVPFLYNRITSTTPISALISTKSPTTTFSVLHLDGTTDWMVAQRSALLAWTGHTLKVTPRIQKNLPFAHWGSTELTGRGLIALSAPGHIYQLQLGEGEEFVAHPANVVAYSINKNLPLPFRFKSSSLRFQVPSISTWFGERFQFFQDMRKTQAYKLLARAMFGLRTAARRNIFGDSLFLQFRGPTTILVSSRGARLSNVLSSAQVNEIADAPAGEVPAAVDLAKKAESTVASPGAQDSTAPKANLTSEEESKAQSDKAKEPKEVEK